MRTLYRLKGFGWKVLDADLTPMGGLQLGKEARG